MTTSATFVKRAAAALAVLTWATAGAADLLAEVTAPTAAVQTVNVLDGSDARMTVFIPSEPSGKAVVCCPGGGYSHLATEKEGKNWADFFNSRGITLGVLEYRMPHGDRSLPLDDAYAAILLMRRNAGKWGVDTAKVGIMGSSAGGHLASTVATHPRQGCSPDFQILFYPVVSIDTAETHKGSCINFLGEGNLTDKALVEEYSNFNRVDRATTPPAIILMSQDDRAVPVLTNGLKYFEALTRAKVPAALCVYPSGGHGWGSNDTFIYHAQMLNDLGAWLDTLK